MATNKNTRSLRVAFVIASNVIGGHEMQVVELVKLVATKCQATVFINRDDQRTLFDGFGIDVRLHQSWFFRSGKLPVQLFRGLAFRTKYARLFYDFDRVVVCAGAVEASLQVGVGLLFSSKACLYLPFIYDRRVSLGCMGLPYTCLLHLLTNLFGNLITISRIQARLISRLFFRNIHVIRNHVVLPESVGNRSNGVRLVVIGRLDRQKQIPELIGDLDYADNPFKTLLIIGDGPLRADVERAAEMANHLEVRMLGWLNMKEQAQALAADDILIVNSLIEGEPIVIREASARGMVVLARDIPGVRGVTLKANRYKSVDELRTKLILGASQSLKLVPQMDASRLAASRERVATKLFGLAGY